MATEKQESKRAEDFKKLGKAFQAQHEQNGEAFGVLVRGWGATRIIEMEVESLEYRLERIQAKLVDARAPFGSRKLRDVGDELRAALGDLAEIEQAWVKIDKAQVAMELLSH